MCHSFLFILHLAIVHGDQVEDDEYLLLCFRRLPPLNEILDVCEKVKILRAGTTDAIFLLLVCLYVQLFVLQRDVQREAQNVKRCRYLLRLVYFHRHGFFSHIFQCLLKEVNLANSSSLQLLYKRVLCIQIVFRPSFFGPRHHHVSHLDKVAILGSSLAESRMTRLHQHRIHVVTVRLDTGETLEDKLE